MGLGALVWGVAASAVTWGLLPARRAEGGCRLGCPIGEEEGDGEKKVEENETALENW